MRIDVITIFPELVRAPLGQSLLGKAIEAGVLDVRVHDLRDWADDPHRRVDDAPFGGGPGMVMRPDVWFRAVESLDPDRGRVLLLSPAGRRLDQGVVRELAAENHLTLLCGRYEGVDERVVEGLPAEEVSIGDYVMSGGELPALVVIEAVTRLVPGVIGRAGVARAGFVRRSRAARSPHYTRPREFRGMSVPDVLWVATTARSSGGAAKRQRPRPAGPGPTWPEAAASDQRVVARRPGWAVQVAPGPLVHSSAVAMNKTDPIEQSYLRSDIPEFRPGDTVKVHVRVVEGSRERVQVFQGVVIGRQNGGLRETFTVRKISFGVGVERTFPVHSPSIAKLEIVSRGQVRRAKLYYLRELRGKKARIKERRIDDAKLAAMEEAAALAAAEAAEAEAVGADDAADDGRGTRQRGAGGVRRGIRGRRRGGRRTRSA